MWKHIPGYTFIKPLGKGRYSDVNLFRSRRFPARLVAIKTVYYYRENQLDYEAALREIEIVCSLDHPRIIKFLTFFEDRIHPNLYIVMSYTRHGSLRDQLVMRKQNSKFYSRYELLRHAYDLIDGVYYLHQQNIQHSDLKPENLLIWKDHRIKICDFGISTLKTSSSGRTPLAWGTPLYLAPEVFETFEQTFMSDIFAIGVIFYEMTTLHHPFEPTINIKDLYYKAYNELYTPIDISKNNYGYKVRDLICKMLFAEIKNRPPLSEVLQSDLFVDFRYFANNNR